MRREVRPKNERNFEVLSEGYVEQIADLRGQVNEYLAATSTTDKAMSWHAFENGTTVGARGSENGVTLLDEEHDFGARITLEHSCDNAPFAITCGVYGWMMHTRFLGGRTEALTEFQQMKEALAAILDIIPVVDDAEVDAKSRLVCDAIDAFVKRFP